MDGPEPIEAAQAGELVVLDMARVARAARELGVLLEVNAQPERLDLNDAPIRLAREAGARLVVVTDAHAVAQLGLMRHGVDRARRGWCAAADIANTAPLAEFLERIGKRRRAASAAPGGGRGRAGRDARRAPRRREARRLARQLHRSGGRRRGSSDAGWRRDGDESMPFRDRADAGRQLATRLTAYAGREDVTLLALPRGGVPVGFEIAKILRVPLDVVIARRLVAPINHQMTIGAVASGGVRVVDEELCRALAVSDRTVQWIADAEAREVERLERVYYGCHRAPPDVRDRTVLLVDDGVATGASMRAAVTAVEQGRPAAIVIAIPVASYAACAELSRRAREFVYCYIRDPVYSVGLWYESYAPVSEQEVCRLLREAHELSASPREPPAPGAP
jgi:predicted phosphoribosyltransferase